MKEKGVVHLLIPVVFLLIAGAVLFILSTALPNLAGSKEATVTLQKQYQNPFDKNVQYVNPFSSYKNPFDSLK